MPQPDEHETLTILRRFPEGDIIALFPAIPEGPGLCQSYQHLGQHSPAGPGIIYCTRPVNPSDPDAVALIRELRSIGYRPRIRQRMPRRM